MQQQQRLGSLFLLSFSLTQSFGKMSTAAPVNIRRADADAPLPANYSTTPHGTIYGSTPGGKTHIAQRLSCGNFFVIHHIYLSQALALSTIETPCWRSPTASSQRPHLPRWLTLLVLPRPVARIRFIPTQLPIERRLRQSVKRKKERRPTTPSPCSTMTARMFLTWKSERMENS